MSRFFGWIFSHKLVTLLLLIVLFLLFRPTRGPVPLSLSYRDTDTFSTTGESVMMGAPTQMKMMAEDSVRSFPIAPGMDAAPAPGVANRMVVENSFMSLQVKNVSESINQIKQQATTAGGYMVESNLSNPHEAANGHITVRVPQEKLDQLLNQFRSLAVKVVSENLQGTDVTDQFVDNEERLRILERNKARMEEIMDQAVEISDITSIQQQLFSIQSQIDSIKGQQNYLEKTTKMSLVTIYLSTDELALPYQPTNSWRPALVFKEAVRSLLTNLQQLGSAAIWIGVYALVIIPVVVIGMILFRTLLRRHHHE